MDAAVPGKVRSETPSWTGEQVGTFLTAVKGQRLSPAFHVLATTGLRRSELLGLRWADVDLDGGTLAVRQVVSLHGYKPFVAEPKTNRSRWVVALGTVTTLKSHRKVQLEERLSAGPAWQDNDLVFAAKDGSILHPQDPLGHLRTFGHGCRPAADQVAGLIGGVS